MTVSKHIILIEDDLDLVDLLTELLVENKYKVSSFTTAKDATDWLYANMPFLIIVDYSLPDANAREFISQLQASGINIPPFIVSTGQGDERIAVEMMKLGALDYIVKDNNFLELFPLTVKKADNLIESENKLRQAQLALKANEERQRAMISNIADVIAIVDQQGINQYKSPNIERLFGWKPNELIGANTFDNVHHDDTEIALNAFRKVMENPEIPVHIEFRYLCRDGLYKWIELTASNQLTNPAINGILLNYHDISQRKETELELIKAKERAEESDRLKTAFLQNMSHEIRTPMNAIMGFSSLLIEKYNNKNKIIEYSDIINQRCNDLLDIINDILDISKIESGQMKVNIAQCNINELFSELTQFFENHKKRLNKQHIEFRMNQLCFEPDGYIMTDKVKLRQIFINLIGNAFKFTDEGLIEAGCSIQADKIKFYIKDTGIGIPADKFDMVFERFAQIRFRDDKIVSGTGLGLSIVKGLVSILGGTVSLESQVGKGSTFYFTLPYNKTNFTANKTIQAMEQIEYNFEGKTILIVEDDYFNAEYLKEILSGTGANLLHTMHGHEAIKLAINTAVDVVLMDVRLPDLNGYEATSVIKAHKPDLKIIAQTAYASINEQEKAIAAGCTAYISKPTRQAAILALIDEQLKS